MPWLLYLWERALLHSGEWVGPRGGLDILEKTNTYLKKTAKTCCAFATSKVHVPNPHICKNLLI